MQVVFQSFPLDYKTMLHDSSRLTVSLGSSKQISFPAMFCILWAQCPATQLSGLPAAWRQEKKQKKTEIIYAAEANWHYNHLQKELRHA